MNDPYKVLGVTRNASDEDIKQAYRELAKKYHPDNYLNNPLNDLAQEKMKEINEAYDFIIKQRSGNAGFNRGENNYGGGNPLYAQVRREIASNNLGAAEKILNDMKANDAEWHFLMGSIMYRRGWYDEARSFFRTACNMDPQNPEYATALRQMSMTGNPYRAGMGGISPCDCCASLLCADCCCNCFGGC